jgi:hypothetical protein
MSSKPVGRRGRGGAWWAAGAVLLLAWPLGVARAQAEEPAPLPISSGDSMPATKVDPNVVQAGCATCGGGGLIGHGSSGCSTTPTVNSFGPGGTHGPGGCGSCCYPGRSFCCEPNCSDSCLGRFVHGMYECICCPDPCYEPRWIAAANSAFFVDAARPVTQMRLRWDTMFDIRNADRAEYLFARYRTNPNQLGPGGPCADPNNPGKGLDCIPRKIRLDELSLYTEAAAGAFGLFVEVPYRHIDPTTAAISSMPCCAESGFADMNVGTKAVLLDCELMQLTFQFKTFIPTGSAPKGMGTGHVSLEPSLLWALKLTPDAYLQGQVSYWIPIGGNQLYQANIFHAHLSCNKLLGCPCPGVQVIGTIEANEWSVLGGNYTETAFLVADPNNPGRFAPIAVSADSTIFSAGPGVRVVICDKIDVGVGSAFNFTGARWAEEVVRAEFRWRF